MTALDSLDLADVLSLAGPMNVGPVDLLMRLAGTDAEGFEAKYLPRVVSTPGAQKKTSETDMHGTERAEPPDRPTALGERAPRSGPSPPGGADPRPDVGQSGGDDDSIKHFMRHGLWFREPQEDWLEGRLPLRFQLTDSKGFQSLLFALAGRERRTRRPDFGRLLPRIARRQPITNLPCKLRRSLSRGVVIYQDRGTGMKMFTSDVDRFIELTRHALGHQRVQVVSIDENGHPDSLPATQDCTALLFSDLHGPGNLAGYSRTKQSAWKSLIMQAKNQNVRLVAMRPGDAAGRVLPSFYPDLLDGARSPVRTVPWDRGIGTIDALRFVQGQRTSVAIEDRTWASPLAERVREQPRYALLMLVALLRDLDSAALRVARLALSEPQLLYRVMLDHTRRRRDRDLITEEQYSEICADLVCPRQPFHPHVSALDEHRLWWSPFLQMRNDFGGFSSRIQDVRNMTRKMSSPHWAGTRKLFFWAGRAVRAGRGLVQLMGDRFVYEQHGRVLTFEEERESREEFSRAATQLRLLGNSDALLNLIAGGPVDRFLATPPLATDLSDDAVVYLCRSEDGLEIQIGSRSQPPNAVVLYAPVPRDTRGASIEIWDSNSKMTRDAPRLLSSEDIRLEDGFTVKIQYPDLDDSALGDPDNLTAVLQVGASVVAASVGASKEIISPLFSVALKSESGDRRNFRLIGRDAKLRFDRDKIVTDEGTYEIQGLKRTKDARVPEMPEPPKGWERTVSSGPLVTCTQGDQWLGVQKSCDSSDFRAIDLAGQGTIAASEGGILIFDEDETFSLVTADAQDPGQESDTEGLQIAHVARWIVPEWLRPPRKKMAVSAAGGLVSVITSKRSVRLILMPVGVQDTVPVSAILRTKDDKVALPRAIAMNDDGLVAVRDEHGLHLFQSLLSLPNAPVRRKAELTKETSEDPLNGPQNSDGSEIESGPELEEHQDRSWYDIDPGGGSDHQNLAFPGILKSPEWGFLNRMTIALKDWDLNPTAEQFERRGLARGADAELLEKIVARDPDGVARALKRGAHADFRFPNNGAGGLILAVAHKYDADALATDGTDPVLRIVQLLLEHGADENQADRWGRTALYNSAFRHDFGAAMELLLDAGADASLTGRNDDTPRGEPVVVGPLAPALWNTPGSNGCSTALLYRLLEGGAEINALMNTGRMSTLHAVATRNDPDLFELIAKDFSESLDLRNEKGWTPAAIAAHTGCYLVLEALLERGASLDQTRKANQRSWSLLATAANRGHKECVELLLNRGADPSGKSAQTEDKQPIVPIETHFNAPESDRPGKSSTLAIVDMLIAHGIRLDEEPWPLKSAFSGTSRQRVAWILDSAKARGKPISLVDTFLNETSFSTRNVRSGLSAALDLGVDPNGTGIGGLTLLHIAAARAPAPKDDASAVQPTVFDTLAAAGATLDASDDEGCTALHYAAAFDNAFSVSELVRLHPDLLNITNRLGQRPIDIARGKTRENRTLGVPEVRRKSRDAKKPSPDDFLRLSFMPRGTHWREIVADDMAVWPSGPTKNTLPLRMVDTYWHPTIARRARLPYKDVDREVIEHWWWREDGTIGVSGQVYEDGEKLFQITGKSPPIHEMNAKSQPDLSSEAAAATYLTFFCHSVHGEEGKFAIIPDRETLRAYFGSREKEVPPRGKSWITCKLKKNGRVGIDSVVRYSHAVFDSRFEVKPSGKVDMLSDDSIASFDDFVFSFFDDANIFYYDRKGKRDT